jgi:hypothetical protein
LPAVAGGGRSGRRGGIGRIAAQRPRGLAGTALAQRRAGDQAGAEPKGERRAADPSAAMKTLNGFLL